MRGGRERENGATFRGGVSANKLLIYGLFFFLFLFVPCSCRAFKDCSLVIYKFKKAKHEK